MKKILYKEHAIKTVVAYLATEQVTIGLNVFEIEVQVNPANHLRILSKISAIVQDSKYQVQEDIGTLVVTVFNGQV